MGLGHGCACQPEKLGRAAAAARGHSALAAAWGRRWVTQARPDCAWLQLNGDGPSNAAPISSRTLAMLTVPTSPTSSFGDATDWAGESESGSSVGGGSSSSQQQQ